MTYINWMDCCGVHEIAGLRYKNRPLQALKDIAPQWLDDECPFLVFTDITKNSAKDSYERSQRKDFAQPFKKLILRLGLGKVTQTRAQMNKNSGNRVRAYLWEVDRKAFKAWAKENKIAAQERDDYYW